MKTKMRRTRDGRILCEVHATTGAPAFHSPGCEACEAAKAKGIVRPMRPKGADWKRLGRIAIGRDTMNAKRAECIEAAKKRPWTENSLRAVNDERKS